jgi:hypothetical protein
MRIISMMSFVLFVFVQCHTVHKSSVTKSLTNIPATYTGRFTDDYGILYSITDSIWVQEPDIKYYLLKYDSTGQYFIARNAATNPGEGGLYSRIDVIRFNNMEPWQWGFCLTAYKAQTPEEAVNHAAADRANPRKGCNGYPFSRMKRVD